MSVNLFTHAANRCPALFRRAAGQECRHRLFGRRGQTDVVEGDPAMRVHPPAVGLWRENSNVQDRRAACQPQEVEQSQPMPQAGAPSHISRLTQPMGHQPGDFFRRHAAIGFETGRRGQQTQQSFQREDFHQQRNQRCQQPDMSGQQQPACGRCMFRVLQRGVSRPATSLLMPSCPCSTFPGEPETR